MQNLSRTPAPPDRPLELGVIGFGKLGLLQAALANSLPGCRLAALADNSSKILSIFQELKPSVRCFSDYQEMLRSVKLDAVIVATPTHLHVPIARDCVAAGLPIFVEKPLCTDSAEGSQLLDDLEKQGGLTHGVGYMNRFSDTFRFAHETIQSGVLGQLRHFRGTMYISQLMRAGKGWRYDKKKSGGGVLITQNSHLLDLLLWTFGEVEWVSAHTQSFFSEVEDAAHCYFAFRNGLRGWIDSSWSVRHYRTLTTAIEVHAENGTLHFNDDEVKLYLDEPRGGFPAGWTIRKKPQLYSGVSFDVAGPHYTRQLEAFLRAVRTGTQPESNVNSAFRVQELLDAIYQSAGQDGQKTQVLKR